MAESGWKDQLVPAGDYFLVELDEEEASSDTGLIVPEKHRRSPCRLGTVQKKGPGAVQVSPGRRVIVSDHAMVVSKDERDRSLRCCTMLDVLFFVEEDQSGAVS